MLSVLRSELPCVAALLACCVGALVTLLGAAPVSRISLHVAAAAFGVSGYALLRRRLGQGDFRRDLVVGLFALALLGLTLLATLTGHVQSWLVGAGVQVQSSELLSPSLLVIAAGLFAREHVLSGGGILLLVALVQFLAPDFGMAIAWAAGALALLAGCEKRSASCRVVLLGLCLLVLCTWLRAASLDGHAAQQAVLAPLSPASLLALACLLTVTGVLILTVFGFAPALVVSDTRASKLAGLALSGYFIVDLGSALGRMHVTVLSLSPWLGAAVGLAALFAQVRAERRLTA